VDFGPNFVRPTKTEIRVNDAGSDDKMFEA